jgi:AbrB family looped-hinge helix DNA binding protein
MPSTSLSTKGQIVIPKVIREQLGLRPGDPVDFVLQDNGDVVMRPAVRDVRSLKGCVRSRRRRSVSLAEMKRAIGQGSERTR